MTDKKKEKEIGYQRTKGAFHAIAEAIVIGALIIMALVVSKNTLGIGIDDSDNGSWRRSGMTVYTDHKTGVQYIGTTNGLCVRVDKNNQPISIWVGKKK